MTATVTLPTDDQDMADKNPFKRPKSQVSSSPTPTINLDDSDLEEEVIASSPVTEEVDQYLQLFIDLLNGDGKKYFIHVPTILQCTSISSSSPSSLLLASIQTLSTLPTSATLLPTLS